MRLATHCLRALALGCLAAPALVWSGQPAPAPEKVGDETPPGYQVREIGPGNQTIKLSGASRLHLKGSGGRRVGNGKVNGLQLESCRNILVTDLTFSGWYQGIRGNGSSDCEFRGVICTLNKQQGWLLNNCSRWTLKGCEGSKTTGTSKSQHGFYAGNYGGGSTADILVEDSTFFGSRLAELQVNAESAKAAAKGIVLRRVKVTNDIFATNFLSATVRLEDTRITSKKKAISADRSYGKSWVTTVNCDAATTVLGNVVTGRGSSVNGLKR